MAENKKKKGFSLADELAKLPDVSKSDTQSREQIEYIDIRLIHPDPKNFYSLDGLEDLAANIELVGLQQPLRLRPDPEAEGEYIISSGHRRHGALTILVNEGKEAFALAASIVKRDAVSPAMQELRLIFANAATRELTSADIAKQAERVEALLYQLKEEGVEFPGRMRDHVAEACRISASKLARLKVIQDKLVAPKFVEMWKTGELKEDPAYVLAQMPALMQEAIAKYKGALPSADVLRKIHERGMGHYLSTPATCEGGEGCTNGEKFLRHDLAANYAWAVGRCKCCVDCYESSCKFACQAGKEKAAEARKAREKDLAQQREAREAKEERKETLAKSVCLPLAERVAGLVGDRSTLASVVKACEAETTEIWQFEGDALEALGFGDPVDSNDGYEYEASDLDIPITLLVTLCRQLGVSADYLLGLSDEPRGKMGENL